MSWRAIRACARAQASLCMHVTTPDTVLLPLVSLMLQQTCRSWASRQCTRCTVARPARPLTSSPRPVSSSLLGSSVWLRCKGSREWHLVTLPHLFVHLMYRGHRSGDAAGAGQVPGAAAGLLRGRRRGGAGVTAALMDLAMPPTRLQASNLMSCDRCDTVCSTPRRWRSLCF